MDAAIGAAEKTKGNKMIEFINTESRTVAKKAAPWAAKIVKVEGGFRAFEFLSDYQAWKNQK